MTRALYTAATGLSAQQFNTDVIANNLANVNTTGFKRVRAHFQDLLYQTIHLAGTPSSVGTQVPSGVQVGHGAKVISTERLFSQGSFRQTENQFHLAIEGAGFFKIILPDGSEAYTRDGSFERDSQGQIVTHSGFLLDPQITIDPEAINIEINQEGVVTEQLPDGTLNQLGQIQLTNFINPSGLQALGSNIFRETAASGAPLTGNPGQNGTGQLRQGFIEISNVNVAEELIDLIVAQRAYEVNSRSIQTQDSMLQTATNLKR
ncbi:MAG: flagellar basal-body rod protein FlgG [Candidatus Hydrogenedentota bacterium]|nr:MAG: flagellar basal-body rod protein FlgG [Candidatus Hydrogenedentota bacterium]